MTKTLSGNPYFFVPSLSEATMLLKFEQQPIMSLHDSAVVGYELLYRGVHPCSWPDVDAALVAALQVPRSQARLFVNLSNQGLLNATVEDLVAVAAANSVVFELSESVTEYAQRDAIAAKVNVLLDLGVPVAIDDFGAGRDSLERIYSLGLTAAVKIDRVFLQTCSRRPDARDTLAYLIRQWRNAGTLSIAEGVENAELLDFARSIDVDLVQGWHVDAIINGTKVH